MSSVLRVMLCRTRTKHSDSGGWKVTAMRALESLEFADLTSNDPISQQQLAKKMLCENTVIELDGLAQESKKFLIPLLCLWLYYVRLESPDREKLKLVIFFEEAHHVLHKREQTANETVLEMLFRQCRELGIGIVVIDQHPHLLSSAALGNTYTTIFLNQKDPSDINKAAAVCLMDADERKYFSMLPVGQGIVKLQDRWTSPVHIQFPLVKVDIQCFLCDAPMGAEFRMLNIFIFSLLGLLGSIAWHVQF